MSIKKDFLKKIEEKIKEKKQFETTPFERPLDKEIVSSSISPFKDCHTAYNYLYDKNHLKTIDIIKELENLLLNETMNPHNIKYSPKEYYAQSDSPNATIKKLNSLCKNNSDEKNLLRLAKDETTIVHIGERGSGKTLVQNIWLYDNNSWMEQNNIIWIRCDAHKLYELWKISDNDQTASIDDYLYGQFVYVFCKYVKKSKFCKDGKNSKLFARIYNELKVHDYNSEPYKKSWFADGQMVYKRDAREGGHSSALIHYQTDKQDKNRQLESLTDWIDKFHLDIISNVREEKKSYSHWMNILSEAHHKPIGSDRVKNLWILIGKWIEHFIINISPNEYYLLLIVDGIDNTPLNNANSVKLYKAMLNQLLKITSIKNPSQRMIKYISFRNSSQRDAALILQNETFFFTDFNRKSDIRRTSYLIRQDVPDDYFEIFKKRINTAIGAVIKKYESPEYKQNIAFLVLESFLSSDNILKFSSKEYWNSNVRCFTFNILHLVEIICFRYYLRGKPSKFILLNQIERFEKINLLLNGRFHLHTDLDSASNTGDNFFNIFGFYRESNNQPIPLIYTRIIQIITNKTKISEYDILELLIRLFKYNESDLTNCLLKLRVYGIIDTKLDKKRLKNREIIDKKKIVYFKNEKTKFCISLFYKDIEYLYNCCLDTEIPANLYYEYHIISETKKSYFAPSIIKTSINFINYLLFLDRKELRSMTFQEKRIFQIDNFLNTQDLLNSFSDGLDLLFQDDDYVKDLEKFLF